MMPATGEWTVDIAAPNGAKAQFVFDTGKSADPFGDMTRQFSDIVCRMPEHDPEPLAGVEGAQPMAQPRRPANG